MQFRVPQFLDIEDKVFGPFTFKEFGYLLGSIAFAYIFWKLLPAYVSMPLIILVSGTFLGLAFIRINERPFGDILEAGFKYFLNAKIYVWKKQVTSDKLQVASYKKFSPTPGPSQQEGRNAGAPLPLGGVRGGAETGDRPESLRDIQKNKILPNQDQGKVIKHFTFDQIKELSNKLDILNQNQTANKKNQNQNLRSELLKERNGFRL